MSDYVNPDTQLALHDGLDQLDWAAVHDEIMQEPWMHLDDDDWENTLVQGAEALPGAGESHTPIGNNLPNKEQCTMEIAADHITWPGPNHIGQCFSGMSSLHDVDMSESMLIKQTDSYMRHNVLDSPLPADALLALPSLTHDQVAPKTTLVCNIKDCNAKPFKRNGDLQRHLRGHEKTTLFSCPAQGCSRTGTRGFVRDDKLKDHMLAGHDADTLFTCPLHDLTCTRDLMSIHAKSAFHDTLHQCLSRLNNYRSCPMPKCSFRIYLGSCKDLDTLQNHILTHDPRGRQNYAVTILGRGYDPVTAKIVCPICIEKVQFLNHSDFYNHFLEHHYHELSLFPVDKVNIPINDHYNAYLDRAGFTGVLSALTHVSLVPREVRQHRRTILSLWPLFAKYPVWEDLGGKQW